jgi:hypothetical protein
VERSCDNCSNIVQFTLGAIAAAVEVVGALVRPDATVDGTRNSDCDADDGANDDERNENADGQSLVLAVARVWWVGHMVHSWLLLPTANFLLKGFSSSSLLAAVQGVMLPYSRSFSQATWAAFAGVWWFVGTRSWEAGGCV